MAIVITPQELKREAEKPSFFSLKTPGGAMFLASVALLVASVGSWLFLVGWMEKVKQESQADTTTLLSVQRSRSEKVEGEVMSTISAMKQLEALLSEHRDGRVLLRLMEDRVQPGVYFTSLRADYEKRMVTIGVAAPKYATLAQQMLAFANDPKVASVTVSKASRRPESSIVEASLEVVFAKDAFSIRSK